MAVDSDSYGTIPGVESLVGDIPLNTSTARTFSTSTTPTLAQVESYIDDVADVLNNALDFAGYVVPVVLATDKYGFGVLNRANNAGAAVMVLDSLPNEAYTTPEGNTQGRKQHLDKILFDAVKLIKEEELSATKSTSGTRLADFKIGSEKDSDGNTKKPFFTRALTDYPESRNLT